MPAPRPYSYVRKSRVFRDKAIVSPEMQLEQVVRLAAGYGDEDLVNLSDMNISGQKGKEDRPGFATLLEAIEADGVTAVYSYSLSRLSRSTKDILALAELCKAHGVPIRLARDPDPDPTSPSGQLILTMLAALATFESDVAKERARDIIETRRARGDKFGPPPFPHPEKIRAAFVATGSYHGAARLLTADGVPTMKGKPWRPTTVRQILLELAEDDGELRALLPRSTTRPKAVTITTSKGVKRTLRTIGGSRASLPYTFYRLLRCHCGAVMTPTRRPKPDGTADYRCTRGRSDPNHSRPVSIAESVIRPWIVEEAGHLAVPAVLDLPASDADREALAEEKRRCVDLYSRRLMTEEAFNARLAEIDETLASLDEREEAVPDAIDWSLPAEEVNRDLRAIFRYVKLGEDLRPVEAVWRAPSLRAS